MADEFERYVEYLQGKMLSDGWEGVFGNSMLKEKFKESSELLRSTLRKQGFSNEESLVQNFERMVAEFEPSTSFDLPYTDQIFGPFLRETVKAAEKIGIKLVRQIRLASSTDIGPSPFA